jgi:hypothetical protein
MGTDPPAMGKGLFGYRKSAVNQMLSDRDVMLRQAEGRVRAAESKVAQLESELTGMRDRNTRMEEQLERLRVQLNALSAGAPAPAPATALSPPPAPAEAPSQEPAPSEPQPTPDSHFYPDPSLYPDAVTEGPLPRYWEPSQEIPYEQPEPAPEASEATEAPDLSAAPAEPEAEEDVWHADETAGEPEAWHPEETGAPLDAESAPSDSEWSADEVDAGHAEADHYDLTSEAPATTPHVKEPWDYPPGYDVDAFGYRREYPEPESPADQAEAAPAPAPEAGPIPAPAEEEPAPGADHWEAPSMEEETVHLEPESPHFEDRGPVASPPPAPSPVAPQPGEAASRFVTEELAGILTAAEESAARIIERAQESSARQIERSTRLWNEVQTEVSRFASWREEVEPVIRTVQSKVENVRALIEEVPERIRDALAGMAESISSIDADLADLSAACNPPLLLTPSELEPGERPAAPEPRPQSSSTPGERLNDDPFGFGRSAS